MTNHYTDVCEATIESLHQQLSAALAACIDAERKLAAEQAKNVGLREALDTHGHSRYCNRGTTMAFNRPSTVECNCYIREALSAPSDTSALDQIKAEYEAQIVGLRDALDNHSGNYKLSKEECAKINALLDTPSDTSALESMISKAGEKLREKCADLCDESAKSLSACPKSAANDAAISAIENKATRIRALPGVTLEDLK